MLRVLVQVYVYGTGSSYFCFKVHKCLYKAPYGILFINIGVLCTDHGKVKLQSMFSSRMSTKYMGTHRIPLIPGSIVRH